VTDRLEMDPGHITATAGNPVIEIDGLTKDFKVGFMIRGGDESPAGARGFRRRTVRALDHLSLNVYEGEVFGFLGPNGAGKTTTLKILMGLVYPTEGSARILGRSISDVEAKASLGYLPENPYFYDYLTGRELLMYTASLFGLTRNQASLRVDELLDIVGLDPDRAGRHLRKYSKGMLQRIGIAQALVNNPQVLFMDEPMSGLDPIGRREVRDLILSLRREGKTVFFSTHILTDVEALCDRVAILSRGRLVRCGTMQELTSTRQPSIEVIGLGTDQAIIEDGAASFVSLISVIPTPHGVHLVLSDESNIEEAIALIRRAGGTLVSVNPSRASLEDLFYE
jgi:ABC-2 type transport system ATP-binding protein